MVAAVSTSVTQGYAAVLGAYPAEGADVDVAHTVVLTEAGMEVQVEQAYVIILTTGRVSDPVIRTWTFTLDGHDYYVLKLGNSKTLLYDTHSESWYNWGSGTGDLWRAYNGCNWLGGDRFAGGYGSNVVVGDDGNGSLYFLDPDAEVDDDALVDDTTRTFERVVQGQVTHKGYSAGPCYSVQLNGSLGMTDDAVDTTVTLSISDDQGNSYSDVGTITVAADDSLARVHWRSLGSIRTPGRLFKVTDYGALTRIDSLDMDDGIVA
jgi:hypothetical protein